MKTLVLVSTAVAATTLVSTNAFAQAAAGATATAQGTTTTADAGMGLPGPQAAAVAGDSDHDMMVGSFALGYLGRRSVPYGSGDPAAGTQATGTTQAPIIGMRYWISPLLGLDAGLGFSMLGDGTTRVETTGAPAVEADLAPVTAFMVHVGVPLALSNTGHFSFQVIPEANVGFATQKVDQSSAGLPEITGTGLALDVGARGGAEIHFGFIGVPQLSLQGSIGLLYRLERSKVESSIPGSTTEYTETVGSFTTTVYDNPWNIFTSNVAALYYF
jgi:hypothetical protein